MTFDLEITNEWTLGDGVTFANDTHYIVCILKAWKVTVLGIDCSDAALQGHFKKV